MRLLPLALVLFTGAWGRRHREAVVCGFAILEGVVGASIFAHLTFKPHEFLARGMTVGMDVVGNGVMTAAARQVSICSLCDGWRVEWADAEL
jgi:hypothetical protein